MTAPVDPAAREVTSGGGVGQPEPRRRHFQLSDLDRCEHGRHFHDVCFDCQHAHPGEDVSNSGNPHLDQVIGYGLGGTAFTVRDLLASLDPERAVS